MQTYDIITFCEEGSDEALIEALLFFRVKKEKKCSYLSLEKQTMQWYGEGK